MTEEEQVAYAMQMSMAQENKRGRDVPIEAHKEGDNVPSPQADQGGPRRRGNGRALGRDARGPAVSRPGPPKGPLGPSITKVGPWAIPSSNELQAPPPLPTRPSSLSRLC